LVQPRHSSGERRRRSRCACHADQDSPDGPSRLPTPGTGPPRLRHCSARDTCPRGPSGSWSPANPPPCGTP
jgi:hypothetical protein